MGWQIIKQKKEQAQQLIEQAGDILTTASKVEKRELTEEESQKFDEMHIDAEKLLEEVRNIEKQEEAEKTLEERIGREELEDPNPTQDKDLKQRAWLKWLRYGDSSLTPEERDARSSFGTPEQRAESGLSTVTAGSGAEFVAEDFASQFVEMLQDLGGVRAAGATQITTATGADFVIPVLDDTAHTGNLTAENTAVTDDDTNDPDTSSVTLKSFMFDSGVVRVPLQLLQDSAFGVEAWLSKALATRIGKITNNLYTVGTGSSQPAGVVTQSTAGVTGSSTTAITYNELLDLKHSLANVYRSNSKFMFSDQTFLAIKKLVDGDGNPLWNAGNVAAGVPSTIDGSSYVINYDMADMGASNKAILYGDFSYYWIRNVLGIQLARLSERYMDKLQIGMIAFSRQDGTLVNTSAVKYFENAAS